jgi:hypothetical protein
LFALLVQNDAASVFKTPPANRVNLAPAAWR